MSKKEISNKTPELNIDETRRRLAKVGIASVPVVLTLTSRPVWGSSCTISGMLSGNLSNPQEETCEGCTPGYWGQHPNNWPAPYEPGTCAQGTSGQHCKFNDYNSDGTLFHDVFAGDLYGSLTMMQVIHLAGTDDQYQLGAHAVAALMNATMFEAGLVNYGYTVNDILNMYADNWASDPEGLKNTFVMLNERYCPL